MSRQPALPRAFLPIQPAVVAQIAAHIAAPHGGRVWDPCAGEGAALAQLPPCSVWSRSATNCIRVRLPPLRLR